MKDHETYMRASRNNGYGYCPFCYTELEVSHKKKRYVYFCPRCKEAINADMVLRESDLDIVEVMGLSLGGD